MQPTTVQPIQQNQRTVIVDILRGWALLGVVLMNYSDAFYLGIDFKTFKPDILTSILLGIGKFLFAAKSWTMLSVLFGYGFGILMQNLSKKGLNIYTFFSRRMFWLLVLAVINSAFFFGDILKDYAIMGMVLLLFWRLPTKVTFYVSVGLLLIAPAITGYVSSLNRPDGMELIAPYFPLFQSHNIFKVLWFGLIGTVNFEFVFLHYLISVHVVMLACLLLGLSAQKINFFNQLTDNKKYLKRIFWSSLVFALLLMGLFIVTGKMKWNWMKYYPAYYLFIISSMIFIGTAICRLYLAGKLKAFFRSMQAIGKMTLTNYITQNVLGVLLFSGFGFGFTFAHRLHYGYYLLFGFVIYVAQVYFSKWWLSRYHYGPIEWIWRQLSYAKRLPIKKENAVAEETFSSTGALVPEPEPLPVISGKIS